MLPLIFPARLGMNSNTFLLSTSSFHATSSQKTFFFSGARGKDETLGREEAAKCSAKAAVEPEQDIDLGACLLLGVDGAGGMLLSIGVRLVCYKGTR